MPATFVHSDGTEFTAEGLAHGIPIDPRLPEDFDNTPNDARPPSHGKWWYLPFIRTETIEAMDAFYVQRTDEYAAAGREHWRENRAKWLAAWPSGTRYDVRCLDDGAWDRSTNWGSFPTLEQAVECALTQGADMNRIVCAASDPATAGSGYRRRDALMAVEYFLIDAPHTVPVEHAAWQEAQARWRIAANRVFECESWDNSDFERLNHAAVEAKQEADRLEQVARMAWRSAHHSNGSR